MMVARVEHNRRRLRMHVHICESRLERGRGLLFRSRPDRHTAFLLRDCRAIHTIGMTYALDVVFCDSGGRILRIAPAVRTCRIARHSRASQVWEFCAGVTGFWGLRVGDEIVPC